MDFLTTNCLKIMQNDCLTSFLDLSIAKPKKLKFNNFVPKSAALMNNYPSNRIMIVYVNVTRDSFQT